MGKNLITIKVAAEIVGRSVETLRQWDKSGKLKANRDPHNGYRYYQIGALEKFTTALSLPKKHRQFKLIT